VEITVSGVGGEQVLNHHVKKAFQIIRSVQRIMSFHDADSDVSRLNRCGYVAPLHVHPWLYQVLSESIALSHDTEGAFDITLAPKLMKSGLLPRHLPAQVLNEAARWADIQLLPNSTVAFRQPLAVDLGSIAKGFAVDKAMDYLSTLGLTGAMVNAGGDLRVAGQINSTVAMRDPRDPHRAGLPSVMLRPALASSPAYFVRGAGGLSRTASILHPRTGKPMRSNVSVSVFSKSCVEADALTKAVLLSPQALWNRLIAARDSVVLLLTRQGEHVLFPA
jgi:thiamine biosynthesis lipoprotein